ncbi:MAG: dTDP-glucose 4,6-dehydratase [Deltaproteobacteria bacterium]|nr:dTDP-glucose 4,6-dehydratase [Deltaproteobacteria bacterium]
MNMKRNKMLKGNILVTGGAGFIGSNFVHYCLKKYKSNLINLDLLTYAGNLNNLSNISEKDKYKFYKGNINDKDLIHKILKDENIECIVNFAAESHVDRSITSPEIFVDTNVHGTFVLLNEFKKHWEESGSPDTFRFLHVSTDEVYGSIGNDGYFTETTPYDPSSPYSASKASSDHFVMAYNRTYNLPTLITNCSNNYGPYQFPEKLIPLMILNILENKELPVYGDGKNVRDWLYVEDHCDAICKVLLEGTPGEQYNIGGNNEFKNIDIVNMLCDIIDNKTGRLESSKSLITFVKDRLGHDMRYAIDASKIKNELGWEPSYTFEKGLPKTVEWYLDNLKWVESIQNGEYRNTI